MPVTVESTSESLVLARADVERAHTALTAAVGDVTAAVTSLVGDGWRGTAATAFGEGFDEWRRGAAQVLEALSETAVALGLTDRAYTASDDAVTDVFARLDARLGGAA